MARLGRNKNGEIVRVTAKTKAKKKQDDLTKFTGMLDGLTPTQLKKMLIDNRKKYDTVTEYAFCTLCDKQKPRDDFYPSTDPMNVAGITPICRECARRIALRVDLDGEEYDPTKESVQLALRYLNKPFVEKVWDSSMQSVATSSDITTVWGHYIRNISQRQYAGMTYFDSDFYRISANNTTAEESLDNKDIAESFQQNKEDTIRLLGYDPFVKEAIADQPFFIRKLDWISRCVQ